MFSSIDRKRYLWVTLSALIQGLLLGQYEMTGSGLFLCIPLTVVVTVPFAFWLAQEHWGRRLRRFLLWLTLVLSLLFAYRLWSVYTPGVGLGVMPFQRGDLIRTSTAVFLLLPFFQCRIATWRWRIPYSEIFFQFCRNVFLLFQAFIVTVVFWALVLTACLLFDIVGLSFIPQNIFSPHVTGTLTMLTVAISISVALKHPGIDSLGRWLLSVLAWLLPPFSVLSLIFLACLPFSGLRTLWSTGQASTLIFLLQLATICLANAAWLDGTRSPFGSRLINGMAQISLLCMPIYTALCAYSLGLRIQQYGLTLDRIQAAFMAIVMGVWGIGYAGAVIMRRWPSAIGRVNMASAVITAVLVAAANSPFLDPYRLAANNQVQRLASGEIAPEDFDYLYMRFSLGRYGNYALRRLEKNSSIKGAASIQRRIAGAMSADAEEYLKNVRDDVIPVSMRREILGNAAVYPKGSRLSASMINKLVNLWEEDEFSLLRGVRRSSDLSFVFIDILNDKDDKELLLIRDGFGLVIDVRGEAMPVIGMLQGDGLTPRALASGEVTAAEPQFMDIELNSVRYRVFPMRP